MIKQAIILAGGLGTRLRSAVPDLPKCMAPVLARPFIGYLMDYLIQQGIERFVLALGYKHEVVTQYLATQFGEADIHFSIETEPLGTGGAIALACKLAGGEQSFILNGDTFFAVDLKNMATFHLEQGAACTLALKPMINFDRYGTVKLNAANQVTGFDEKRFTENGLINGGVYALNISTFVQGSFPQQFSFEHDFLKPSVELGNISGIVEDKYFIDIGIPADFERAQTELTLNFQSHA